MDHLDHSKENKETNDKIQRKPKGNYQKMQIVDL
jgi:hypothetical protein